MLMALISLLKVSRALVSFRSRAVTQLSWPLHAWRAAGMFPELLVRALLACSTWFSATPLLKAVWPVTNPRTNWPANKMMPAITKAVTMYFAPFDSGRRHLLSAVAVGRPGLGVG